MSDEQEKQEKKSHLAQWGALLTAIAAILGAIGASQIFPDIVKRYLVPPSPTPIASSIPSPDLRPTPPLETFPPKAPSSFSPPTSTPTPAPSLEPSPAPSNSPGNGASAGSDCSQKGLIASYLFNGNFNGKSDYITIKPPKSLQKSSLSLTAWIYVRQYGLHPAIVEQGNVGKYNESFALYLGDHDGKLGFILNRDNTEKGRTKRDGTIGSDVSLNKWTHIAGTYDGKTMTIYKNGEEVGTESHEGGVAMSDDPILIGKSDRQGSNIPSSFLDGMLKDVRIYNCALTPEDVVGQYDKTR